MVFYFWFCAVVVVGFFSVQRPDCNIIWVTAGEGLDLLFMQCDANSPPNYCYPLCHIY